MNKKPEKPKTRKDVGSGKCPSRENHLGELNADPHSVSPSHAATADGCVVKHKIEGIGNSDGIFHFEAGAPVRQVADSTIDRRSVTFEGDVRSLENAARFIPALLLRFFHCSIFPPYALRCVSRGRRAYAASLAPNVAPVEPPNHGPSGGQPQFSNARYS
jgi:hypothetical protein